MDHVMPAVQATSGTAHSTAGTPVLLASQDAVGTIASAASVPNDNMLPDCHEQTAAPVPPAQDASGAVANPVSAPNDILPPESHDGMRRAAHGATPTLRPMLASLSLDTQLAPMPSASIFSNSPSEQPLALWLQDPSDSERPILAVCYERECQSFFPKAAHLCMEATGWSKAGKVEFKQEGQTDGLRTRMKPFIPNCWSNHFVALLSDGDFKALGLGSNQKKISRAAHLSLALTIFIAQGHDKACEGGILHRLVSSIETHR